MLFTQPTAPSAISSQLCCTKFLLVFLLALTGFACSVESTSEPISLIPASLASGDNFGATISSTEKHIVVGAAYDDESGPDAGAVYVYNETGLSQWGSVAKLTASDGTTEVGFGRSVAADENTIVVGSFSKKPYGASGAVYIFERSVDGAWSQSTKLAPDSPIVGENFGVSVAVSGSIVLIGANAADSTLAGGAAYVFEKRNDLWRQTARLAPSKGSPGDGFGTAVETDGQSLFVGANSASISVSNGPEVQAGAVFLFEADAFGNWEQTDKLQGSQASINDRFGQSISVDESTLAIGAPGDKNGTLENAGASYLFARHNGVWTERQRIVSRSQQADAHFGQSVSISNSKLVVGAHQQDTLAKNLGAAFVFNPDSSGVWVQTQELFTDNNRTGDSYGFSVSVSSDVAVVGARGFDGLDSESEDSGAVFVFPVESEDGTELAASSATPELMTAPPALLAARSLSKSTSFVPPAVASEWTIYDNDPGGALVTTVYDDDLKTQVLELSGNGVNNGYRLGGISKELKGWNETSLRSISWQMRTSEDFGIYVAVETVKGFRYLAYDARSLNATSTMNGAYIFNGLGSEAISGEWLTVTRDLSADLLAGEREDNQIIAVHGIYVRGNLLLNNISLGEAEADYIAGASSALTGSTTTAFGADEWRIYDNNPIGARIDSVYDVELASQVVQLTGGGKTNGYRLGGPNVEFGGWNYTGMTSVSWKMRTTQDFGIYVAVETTKGFRYIAYDERSTVSATSKSGSYIYSGLGSVAKSGEWITVSRNLVTDLISGEVDNSLIAVHGFYARGNMKISDVEFGSASNVERLTASTAGAEAVATPTQVANDLALDDSQLKQFGNPVAGYGLANQMVGRAHATSGNGVRRIAFAFEAKESGSVSSVKQYVIWSKARSGYHGGTGGLLRIDIVRDINGSPSNDVLSTGTYKPDINSSRGYFNPAKMSGGWLTKGERYWIRYTQIDPNPLVNWVSVNTLNNGESLSFTTNTSADFQPHRVKRSDNNGAWVTSSHYGIYEIEYSKGSFQGNGYIGSHAFNSKHLIGGSNRVRQKFIPLENMNVKKVVVSVAKVYGRGELALRIRDLQGREITQSYSKGFDKFEGASSQAWVPFSISDSVQLEQGREYYLELEAPIGSLYFSYPSQSGDLYGFSTDSLGFAGEDMELTVNSGKQWAGWSYDGRDDRRFQEMSAVVLYR